MDKLGYVYILTNTHHRVLYTGVTSNLRKRIEEHRTGVFRGFSKKYKCWKLVFCEVADDIQTAIAREKQIKAGSRTKKIALITAMNPDWRDLTRKVLA